MALVVSGLFLLRGEWCRGGCCVLMWGGSSDAGGCGGGGIGMRGLGVGRAGGSGRDEDTADFGWGVGWVLGVGVLGKERRGWMGGRGEGAESARWVQRSACDSTSRCVWSALSNFSSI